MYYYLDNGLIIGQGAQPHTIYENIAASEVNIPNPMGYELKNGKFVKSKELIDGEKYEAKLKAKAKQAQTIANLKVEVGNKTFDADEKSQQRMMIAIQSMEDGESTVWRLANNMDEKVSKYELEQALKLVAAKMSEIIVGDNGNPRSRALGGCGEQSSRPQSGLCSDEE